MINIANAYTDLNILSKHHVKICDTTMHEHTPNIAKRKMVCFK